jgi:signal transduction histidine kinase
LSIQGRTVRLAITPVRLGVGQPEGTLVTACEIGLQRDQVLGSLWTYSAVSMATLLLAGVVGLLVTGRLLAPIRRLREATETISFEDLTRRVHVPASDDDVTQLALNFNQMLDRLEAGFANQRRFVDDAGHELRTPLTIIRGYLELLEADDPQDVAQTRALLLDEMDRMQGLVDELLVLARSGRPDFVRLDWVDADAFLEDAMDRIKVLGNRHWKIDEKAGGRIRADRNRLTQAVEQLAANAVKFSVANDEIALGARWVPLENADSDGHAARSLEIWVRDTGCGIAPEDQHIVFERFGRAASGLHAEGSGLGLPIVKAIAEAHAGAVTLESRVGQGSRFVLSLPPSHGSGPLPEPESEPEQLLPHPTGGL